ncbi:Pol polyprotein [Plakobranchus ocellatus]|uniref:Pol polyprotein n=1 Tax=Plakobranchus ocellatus TaxID=259542 RepID=A0AAV4BES6_9GAST|nr:Pol polyprotein [Plakobranchus ocellatus]
MPDDAPTLANISKRSREKETRETGERTSTRQPICWFALFRGNVGVEMTQLFVTDEKSERRFLVDTGAQASVTPVSWADKVSGATGPNLQAANGSSIATYVSTDSDLTLIEPTSNRFRKILNGYPELLQPTFSTAEVKHGVKHFIPTKGRPVFARARRLAPDKVAPAKKEILEMEKMGIIQKSNSPWASPLHMVPKSNGGYAPVGIIAD